MADHNLPTLASLYTEVIDFIDARLEDLAKDLEPSATTVTNAPTGSVRFNESTKVWEKWNGTAWVARIAAYNISINGTIGATTPNTGAFTTIGTGGAGNSGAGVYVGNNALSGTSQVGVISSPTGTSGATSVIAGFRSTPNSAAAAFTAANVIGLWAQDAVKGAGSTITAQHGVYIADQTQGSSSYGLTSLVSAGANKWNLYISGSANNAIASKLRIGSTAAPTKELDVTGDAAVSGTIASTNVNVSATLSVSGTTTVNSITAQDSVSVGLTLSEVLQSLHSGAVVRNIVYDTSKDSDGGAWRDRCQHTSWYNEAHGFTGKWLGQLATTAAAWATSGAAAGDGFQNTTDGKFYVLTGTSTASEITRGNVRKAPALPLLVAQNTPMARVVVYDATQSTRPMWRVFAYTGKTINSVRMLDGKLFVGTTTGLFVEDLVADSIGKAERYTSTTTPAIVNSSVNDVAVTALETAPIDAATGLPVPTIAVGTTGGVSVIKDDGTVVNSSSTASSTLLSIAGSTVWLKGVGNNYLSNFSLSGITESFAITSVSTPFSAWPIGGTANTASTSTPRYALMASNGGVACLLHNPSTPAKGMVAYITNTYNTGWMVGDIRGALLADTSAETISASGELVANGTFTTDTSGWTAGNAATLSVVSGAMRITVGTNYGYAATPITCVVGKTYRFQLDTVGGTAAARTLQYGTTSAITVVGPSIVATGTGSIDFVATATTMWVGIVANGSSTYQDIDNVSVKLVDPDRCVKNKGLIVNGSITKTAVAAGAGLVAYSGFSVANFLEQPYSADLDFGTADFEKPMWVAVAATQTALETIWCRDSATTGKRIKLQVNASGYLTAEAYDGTTSRVATGTVSVRDGVYRMVSVRYVAATGTLTIKVNNATYASATGTPLLTLSNASAIFRVGLDCQGANPGVSVSACLLRVSATVASDDQLDYIYRTEWALFQPGAQCTLAGSSASVTALTYDPDTTLLQAGTSWGRSSFKDLTRVDSEATSVGAVTSLSAVGGVVLTGGASSARVYMPALSLRDELRRKAEARKALNQLVVPLEYIATAGQTTFSVTKGYTVRQVFANQLLKHSSTYTVSDDGFRKTLVFSSGLLAGVPVTLLITRG